MYGFKNYIRKVIFIIDLLVMQDQGEYPSQTGAQVTARYYTVDLPEGIGDCRYFIEAIDHRNNRGRGALERIFLA